LNRYLVVLVSFIYLSPFKVQDFSGNYNGFRQDKLLKHSHSMFWLFNAD